VPISFYKTASIKLYEISSIVSGDGRSSDISKRIMQPFLFANMPKIVLCPSEFNVFY